MNKALATSRQAPLPFCAHHRPLFLRTTQQKKKKKRIRTCQISTIASDKSEAQQEQRRSDQQPTQEIPAKLNIDEGRLALALAGNNEAAGRSVPAVGIAVVQPPT